MCSSDLAAAVVTALAQVAALAARERRTIEQRTVAVWEAGNVMEELLSRRWADTAAEKLAALPLSETCRRILPDAQLRVDVVADGAASDCRRIAVRIDWRNAAGQRGVPVQLVAWKYRDEEAGP